MATIEQPQKLIWIGATFDKEDVTNLQKWLNDRMNTGIRGSPPHVTIMYSNFAEGITHIPAYFVPVEAKHIGWAVFNDNKLGDKKENGGILVMLLSCSFAQKRHDELMKVPGATWDHDELRPHISVLEWAKPSYLDTNRLPIYPGPIRLVGEEVEVWDE